MSLREATVADLDGIMAIERMSFLGDAWSTAVMEADIASPHTWYVVWEEGAGIRGYAGLRAPAGSADADVQTIALAADARGRGQGRALLRALLSEATRRGAREVFLDVRDDNTAAQSLYVSEGFVPIGRRPNYYPADGGVDAIVMKLELRGWVAHHARTDAAAPGQEWCT
ncbi:N-alpha-acetyltransferase RimI [Microbacterium lemovicicum]|uniref:N-alpha-acetyltransferase RimI n=1 Tax=Microbacterium lemovicicum TaxID=1072463 RepID=A0A3Q9IY89_9MICO|nr:ribosomal protein S18-alanine N-acetyltransferase [Microbacterium lemovicicum]AZS35928.1 N-alpha-acetyltransferase RimI [Microbacterium lemovicicum]